MKLLNNPLVTTGLVVVAVAVVAYQFIQPNRVRAKAAAPTGVVPVAAAAKGEARAAATPAPPAAPVPSGPGIDTNYAHAHLAEWTDSPRHDPFLLVPDPAANPAAPQPPSPVAKWKLQGIWRQTGGRVAAIDNRVYSEGETIAGYKIERIDADRVWFQGPNRKEHLDFELK